jgi:hypothetical protein
MTVCPYYCYPLNFNTIPSRYQAVRQHMQHMQLRGNDSLDKHSALSESCWMPTVPKIEHDVVLRNELADLTFRNSLQESHLRGYAYYYHIEQVPVPNAVSNTYPNAVNRKKLLTRYRRFLRSASSWLKN